MFERSRYNWAATQVETCLKFDFDATNSLLTGVKEALADDSFFKLTDRVRKTNSYNWYAAMGFVAGDLLAKMHNELRDDAPITRSYAYIYIAAVSMVMTKMLGIPQALEWIDEQLVTFKLVDDSDAKAATDPTPIPEKEVNDEANAPYALALNIAIEQLDLPDNDQQSLRDEIQHWTAKEAWELADLFEIREQFDHVPWELHPLVSAAIHKKHHELIEEIMGQMREDLDKNDGELGDLNVMVVMMFQATEASLAISHMKLFEACFEAMGLEWDEQARGNVYFFMKRLERIGFDADQTKTALIERIRTFDFSHGA